MATPTPVNIDDQLMLGGDQAKRTISDDEFGLSNMVEAVADALTGRLTESGYVVGIEGKWGSGKSTLVNFIAERIHNSSANHHVIKFEPWLIGKGDSLLSHFFGLLAAKIDEIDDGTLAALSTASTRRKKNIKLSEKLRLYGQYAGLAAISVGDIATLESGHHWIAALSIALRAWSQLSKFWRLKKPTLEELKKEIEGDLKTLAKLQPGLRFCIIIDDLDRLEPVEAIEILRLVKKVGDFPYLTYLLCFDREILAEQVEQALRAGNGEDFLEKIFQNIVPLPPQEPFALRRFLRKILQESFPGEMNRVFV